MATQMSSLAKPRARRAEDKLARRQDILRAAQTLLSERRFGEIKMIDVARQAGLAKGTVFLYFPTKESLFLELVYEMLVVWLEEVNVHLDNARGRWTSSRVARIFTDTLMEHDLLTRLLTLVSSVLEHNVDAERIAGFKHRLMDILGATGTRLERRLAFVRPGDGIQLLLRIYALVVGVRQLTDPGDTTREVLTRPELAPLAVEFKSELRILLGTLLKGLEVQASGSVKDSVDTP